MPSRLPVQDIFAGLVASVGTAIRYWFHYTLVAFAWLGVVPLTACTFPGNTKLNGQLESPVCLSGMSSFDADCAVPTGRIYKCLFTGSVSSLLTLPLDMLST